MLPRSLRSAEAGRVKFLSLQNTGNAVSVRCESERETRTYSTSTPSSQRKRFLLEEYLETDFKGSVYHPNLAEFYVNLENGLGQNRQSVNGGPDDKVRNRRLNRYHVLSTFLRKKPYAFSLFADQSFEMNNQNFFERQYIDWAKFGGNFGYRNDRLPVRLSLSNDERTIRRASRPSQLFRDDQANLSLSHTSGVTGDTRFDITRDEYIRTESGTYDQSGTIMNYNVYNQKYLFGNRGLEFNSSLRSNALSGTAENSQFAVNERLEVTHSDSLRSGYRYDFSDNTSGTSYNKGTHLSASVRHRFYESLHSSLDLDYFTDKSTSLTQDQRGIRLTEDYVKKLGNLGRFSAGAALGYETEDRRNSQDILVVFREPHTLTTGTLTLLEQPNVRTATVIVTDVTGSVVYLSGIDYQLDASGIRTQIRRIPGGAIADGQSVWVDYHADSSPLFYFNTYTGNYRARLDFFDNLVGVFCRYSKISHPEAGGDANAILESLDDRAYGADLRYRNLTVEWESQDYASNISPYRRDWLREGLTFSMTPRSAYWIQSSQSRLELLDPGDLQNYYDIINRYTYLINRQTRLSVEGGFRRQKGSVIDTEDWTLRCLFETSWGDLAFSAQYEFEKLSNIGENTDSHFFYSKVRRTF